MEGGISCWVRLRPGEVSTSDIAPSELSRRWASSTHCVCICTCLLPEVSSQGRSCIWKELPGTGGGWNRRRNGRGRNVGKATVIPENEDVNLIQEGRSRLLLSASYLIHSSHKADNSGPYRTQLSGSQMACHPKEKGLW